MVGLRTSGLAPGAHVVRVGLFRTKLGQHLRAFQPAGTPGTLCDPQTTSHEK
jgi:hypothetical protein